MICWLLAGVFGIVCYAAFAIQGGTALTLRQHDKELYERIVGPVGSEYFWGGPLGPGSFSFLLYIVLNEFKYDRLPEHIRDSLILARNFFYVGIAALLAAIACGLTS